MFLRDKTCGWMKVESCDLFEVCEGGTKVFKLMCPMDIR